MITIVSGIGDTRKNQEDFAITPYLFSVIVKGKIVIYGIGICWGYYSAYVGFGKNVPKEFRFINLTKSK